MERCRWPQAPPVMAVRTASGCIVGVAQQFTLPCLPLLKPWQSAHNVLVGHGLCLLVCVLYFRSPLPAPRCLTFSPVSQPIQRWESAASATTSHRRTGAVTRRVRALYGKRCADGACLLLIPSTRRASVGTSSASTASSAARAVCWGTSTARRRMRWTAGS